jgi:hypothetical protein
MPLPPAVRRAIARATDNRSRGPIVLTRRGARMDRHCATRRLERLAEQAGVKLPRMHPHVLSVQSPLRCSQAVGVPRGTGMQTMFRTSTLLARNTKVGDR